MNYVEKIVETISDSVVARVLVVDDSYDVPTIEIENIGDLHDLILSDAFQARVDSEEFDRNIVDDALEAIANNEIDADSVITIVSALYSEFSKTREVGLDPGGIFNAAKGASLDALQPLVEILKSCDDVDLQLVGLEGAVAECEKTGPDLIFMDFFLSPPTRAEGPQNKGQEDSDRKRSIDTLKQMLKVHPGPKPAVVLMSSKDVRGRTKRYRASLEGQVMSLRFGYLHKQWLTGSGDDLFADGNAMDVFADTSGGLAFGRALESALSDWKNGAEEALDSIQEELLEFDVKDFAYLLRFRLYNENEPFADYLEWFLGETLRAVVDDTVPWTNSHFRELDKKELTASIAGAHPFPSDAIAKFFHRMRFASHGVRARGRFALGDVFIAPDRKSVRMVLSPDCDLVIRDGGRAAPRILTVGGDIKGFKEDSAFAEELVHLDAPKGIKWKYKDLMTHDAHDPVSLSVGNTEYEFMGRLRSLPAQAVQNAALSDLSRVGLAVPPTIHVGAKVQCFIRILNDGRLEQQEIDGLPSDVVQIVMPRGGDDKHKKMLFTHDYARSLISYLEILDEEKFHKDHLPYYRKLMKERDKLLELMVYQGTRLPGEIKEFAVFSNSAGPTKKPWLQFVCTLADDEFVRVNPDALE